MLEVRYIETTGEVTGWWGSRFGNHGAKLKNRTGEVIVELDIDVPSNRLDAYLFDTSTNSLIPNPNHVEPKMPIDLAAEIARLKADILALKEGGV